MTTTKQTKNKRLRPAKARAKPTRTVLISLEDGHVQYGSAEDARRMENDIRTASAQSPAMREQAAAAYLQMSYAWLRATRNGRTKIVGPDFIRLPSGSVLYLKSDLDRWLLEHREDAALVHERSRKLRERRRKAS